MEVEIKIDETRTYESAYGDLNFILKIKNEIFSGFYVEKKMTRGFLFTITNFDDLKALWRVMLYLNGIFKFDKEDKK